MKRILCLALALLTVILAGVSCGNTPDDPATVPTDTTAEVVTEAPTTEAETEAPVVFKDFDIKQFTIVYEGFQNVSLATTLQSRFKKELGVDLKVVQATATNESEYEFVIGETQRAISKYALDLKNSKYLTVMGIYSDNGKVQILGVDKNTVNLSIDYLFKYVSINKTELTMNIPEKGAVTSKTSDKMIQVPAKADSTYIRFVTNNILQQKLKNSWDRVYGLFGFYAYLDADIFALQEVDAAWHNDYGFTERMEAFGYSIVTNNKDVGCPIFYKTDRFTLVEGGYQKYDLTNSPEKESRTYSWACLEEKSTGKKLIVMGTHFIANGAGSTSEQKANRNIHRQVCANELVAKSEELMKKYGAVGVIMAGDYNSDCNSEAYKILSTGLNSARELAPEKVNMDFATDCSVGTAPSRGATKAIDHVFYSKTGVTPKLYQTVVSKYSYAYSDHVPVFMDFVLN